MSDENLLTTKGIKRRPTVAYPPFYPSVRKDGATYKVSLSRGYVIERRLPDGNALIYHLPTGLVDGSDKPVEYAMSSGDCLYVDVPVKEDGTIEEGTASVVKGADNLAGAHYRPKIFDFSATAGEHKYKICKFELVSGRPKLTLFGAGDNIDHYDERVTMENLEPSAGESGSFYEVGKTYETATDKAQFRKLKQITDGPGVEIIKNQTANSINFRKIKPRDYEEQIRVEEEGDAIKVHGNGRDGTLSHVPCGETVGTELLRWVDGLVTTEGEVTFEAGCTGSGSGHGGGMS
jgi:hypothetical protein